MDECEIKCNVVNGAFPDKELKIRASALPKNPLFPGNHRFIFIVKCSVM